MTDTEYKWLFSNNIREMSKLLDCVIIDVDASIPAVVSEKYKQRFREYILLCRHIERQHLGTIGEYANNICEDVGFSEAIKAWFETIKLPLVGKIQPANLFREIFGNPFNPIVLPVEKHVKKVTVLGVDTASFTTVDYATYDQITPYCTVRVMNTHPWLTPTVLKLAKSARSELLPDRTVNPEIMAVLSDALEDAGCIDQKVLQHLRGFEYCQTCRGTGTVSGLELDDYLCCDCRDGWVPLRIPHYPYCWVLRLLLESKEGEQRETAQ